MTTTQTKDAPPTFDTAFDQMMEQGDRIVSAARKAGSLYLDSYEKAVDRAIELELELAGMTQQEWLKGLLEAQADFVREVTDSYTTTARSLLK